MGPIQREASSLEDRNHLLIKGARGRIKIRGPQADGRTFARTRCAALVPRGGCRSRTLHRHGCEPAAKFPDRTRTEISRPHRKEPVETRVAEDMSVSPTIEGIS